MYIYICIFICICICICNTYKNKTLKDTKGLRSSHKYLQKDSLALSCSTLIFDIICMNSKFELPRQTFHAAFHCSIDLFAFLPGIHARPVPWPYAERSSLPETSPGRRAMGSSAATSHSCAPACAFPQSGAPSRRLKSAEGQNTLWQVTLLEASTQSTRGTCM